MNIPQEIFLVLFSIMYGVMLQSLSGLQPFPLGRTRRGFVGRYHKGDDMDVLREREFGDCERVFFEENQISLAQFDDCYKKI